MSGTRIEGAAKSLGSIAALKGVPPETLARVQGRCAWRSYASGQPIVHHLDQTNDVYFITAGSARVSLFSAGGKAVTFCDLAAGEIFGEYAAIDGGPRSASIEARTDCLVASMSAAAFQEMLESEPAVAQALLRYLVAKVRELTTRVYEVSALAVNNRIQAELLRLARNATRFGNSARIETAPTHAEIASRTSTHREAVTRELSRLTKIGLIERRGRDLIVRDVQRLAEFVESATGE